VSGKTDSVGGDPRKGWLRALQATEPIFRNPSRTLPIVIDELAKRFGAHPALVSERQCLTYRSLADRVNSYSRWALAQGLGAGSVVCLLMANCPEYLAIWLGVTRVGAVVALVNTNASGQSLVHAIDSVDATHVIAGADLAGTLAAALPRLGRKLQCWVHGTSHDGFRRIDDGLESSTAGPLDKNEFPAPSIVDPALYIYTSGTTGMPKAARVSHSRVMQWSYWFAGMMGTRSEDRMYNCLPMYHSVGGVVATGAVLVNGGTVVLRDQFSTRRFWDDIVETKCTLFQYIGELCRYLVNSSPHPRETEHQLRLCCGNGLRADVWEEFKRRFRVPQILEFYAATEGNFSLYNCEGKPGAIGRIPPFLGHRFPIALVKSDIETGAPVRDQAGACIPCSANEVGEAIGRIPNNGVGHGGHFEGYADKAASELKIVRDVFAKGDAWYRTGDLMRRDEAGYYYFVDRIGDTFRWKGENVSTMEVAETISACPGVIEAIVYGVAVPGAEGRAGMAAVVVGEGFDLGAFRAALSQSMPEYARPLFVRIRQAIEATATFKPKKRHLMDEGYDLTRAADHIYFDDRASQSYVRLDSRLYEAIMNRQVRV
jgi:fatty-acyl-CoA synthase